LRTAALDMDPIWAGGPSSGEGRLLRHVLARQQAQARGQSGCHTGPESGSRPFHRVDAVWATSFRLGTHEFIDAALEGRPASRTPEERRATLAVAVAAPVSGAEQREVPIAELG